MSLAKLISKIRQALRVEVRAGTDGVRQFDYEVRNMLVSRGVFHHFMISGPDDEVAARELARKAKVPFNIVRIHALPFGGDIDRALGVITKPYMRSNIERALSESTLKGQSLNYLFVIRTSCIGATSSVAEEVGRIVTNMFGDSFVVLALRFPVDSLDLHYRKILQIRTVRIAGLVSNGRILPVAYPLSEYARQPSDFHRGLIAQHLFLLLTGVEQSGDPINILRGLASPLERDGGEYNGLPLAIPLYISPLTKDPSLGRQSIVNQLTQLTWEHPAVFRVGRFFELKPLFDAASVVGCLHAPEKDGELLREEIEDMISDSLGRLGISDVGPNIRLVNSSRYALALLIGPMLARRFYLGGDRNVAIEMGVRDGR